MIFGQPRQGFVLEKRFPEQFKSKKSQDRKERSWHPDKVVTAHVREKMHAFRDLAALINGSIDLVKATLLASLVKANCVRIVKLR